MLLTREDNKSLLVVTCLLFLTRIPFVFNGYGSEEDAWGLLLVARNINLSGIYEVSRMPGHPVQEYLLSLMWQQPAWVLNLLTALVASAGVFCFMKTLVHLHVPGAPLAGIALGFVPVFYIHSTDIMDYNWTLALVLFAFYLLVTNKYMLAGIVIGIACGFRVTAGAMVVPFALWHYMHHRSVKAVFISGVLTLTTALLCFIPAFKIYGTSFFTYYEYFPYPPFLKNVYKGTVGAWGVLGMLAVVWAFAITISRLRNGSNRSKNRQALVWLCITTIALFTYSFLKIPQKTAFVLPMVPFLILLFALYLNKREMQIFAGAMLLSCFFIGVNLDDPLRGSKTSDAAIKMTIGQTPVVIDLLNGLVTADHTKRIQKMDYAAAVVDQMKSVHEKTVLIAGFWQNELKYFALQKKNPQVTYLYYADEKQLRDSIRAGCAIFYLPEQDYYNDLRYSAAFTTKLAEPFGQVQTAK